MNDFESKLVIISGPSGAGKDTIVEKLIERDKRFSLSVSATTRKPRPGEKHGENYYFISEEEFDRNINEQAFVEYAFYGTNRYGTLKSDVKEKIENGKTVILVIDVQGEENIKKMFPRALSIFIMPPSSRTLEERLRRRCTDSEEAIEKRLKIAKSEMEKSEDFDYIVVNDALEDAVSEVYDIILSKTDIRC